MTAFRKDFELIVKGILPFILIMLTNLLLISLVPQLKLHVVD
jgi:TRAP-type C4-dicarboxylate transport system permease large subunit